MMTGLNLAKTPPSVPDTDKPSVTPPTTTPDPEPKPDPKPEMPPIVATVDALAVAQLPFNYQLAADKSRAGMSFKAVSLPAWASLDTQTGLITGTPSEADVSAKVTFSVEQIQGEQVTVFNGTLVVLHSAALANNSKIDFYDTPFDGHPRPYRNDLTGSLKGEVQFVQTHSMAPTNTVNYHVNKDDQTKSQYMPDSIALRSALVLFIPEQGVNPVTVDMQVSSPNSL